jgi:hypothetical protein
MWIRRRLKAQGRIRQCVKKANAISKTNHFSNVILSAAKRSRRVADLFEIALRDVSTLLDMTSDNKCAKALEAPVQ